MRTVGGKEIENVSMEVSLSRDAEKNLISDSDWLWPSLIDLAKIGPS